MVDHRPERSVGYRSLEAGRYMNNQIGEDLNKDDMLFGMNKAFAEAFNLSEKRILISFIRISL